MIGYELQRRFPRGEAARGKPLLLNLL